MSKYFFAYDSNDKDIKLTCNYTLYPNKILRVTCLFFSFFFGGGDWDGNQTPNIWNYKTTILSLY